MALKDFPEDIQRKVKSELQDALTNIMLGVQIKYTSPYLSPSDVIDFAKSKMIISDDSNTNGWAADFFYDFKYKKRILCVSGSAYYGSPIEVHISDSEED